MADKLVINKTSIVRIDAEEAAFVVGGSQDTVHSQAGDCPCKSEACGVAVEVLSM